MKTIMISLAVGLLSLALAPCAAAQANPTPDQLIDQLTQINCNGPELFNAFPYDDFWAVVPEAGWKAKAHIDAPHSGGRPPDCVPDAMRALVRLGPQALPALVRHIDDTRPTGLKIGVHLDPSNHMGGQSFSEEYDSRAHVFDEDAWPSMFLDKCADRGCFTGRWFHEPYTVRVGDVCFTLIGQIVNRNLVAVRYQWTAIIVVNSPIETPSLAEKVRADWTGVDAEGLKVALLDDLHMRFRKAPPGYKRLIPYAQPYGVVEQSELHMLYAGALRRLRFYYPETYAALSGDDLVKRKAFEQEEAKEKADYGK
jgi:hypothetical protein